ncbi:MAG: hypothetical protein ACYC3I_14560, partial [Gemmataceae bacterium]
MARKQRGSAKEPDYHRDRHIAFLCYQLGYASVKLFDLAAFYWMFANSEWTYSSSRLSEGRTLMECSPKSDPGAMRVSEAHQGQETNHETTQCGRDYPQAAT